MRKLITFLLFLSAYAAKAQTSDTSTVRLEVFSSLGLSFVDNNYDPASGNSIQTATGLELRLSGMSSIGLGLAFDSYGYKRSGTGYNLDGSLKSTALAAFYRYKFGSSTWQPYLKAGGGTTWLTVPTVSVAQGTTNIKKETQNVGLALAEVGLQARVLPRYSLLFAGEKRWMGKASLLDDTSLGTITFKIGLISSF